MKRDRIIIISLAALVVGIIAMVTILQGQKVAEAFTGSIEYAELTSTHTTSSTVGTAFQGNVSVCAWNTTGGSFSGTVYVEIKYTLGNSSSGSKNEWIRTGDTFTGEKCMNILIPENGVKLRFTSTVSSGSIRVRASQEYPEKVWNVGR